MIMYTRKIVLWRAPMLTIYNFKYSSCAQIVIIAACIAVAVAVHGPVGYSVHTVHDDHHGGHYGGGHYGGGIVGGHYGGQGGYAGVAHGYYGHGDEHSHQDYHVIYFNHHLEHKALTLYLYRITQNTNSIMA